jgi:predicted MPP superfamily phosphohydrolase
MMERTEHIVTLSGLPTAARGLRVVQLTDIHRSRLTHDRLLRHAVAAANAAQPDLIVLTGDFVTNRPSDIEPCARILAPLRARLGVYAILGNHDYSTDAPAVERALLHQNITVLKNHKVRLENGLWLVGLDDDHAGKTNVSHAFAGIEKEELTFTLIHNPALAEQFSDRNALAVGGHTHGGQMFLPVITKWAVRRIGAKEYRAGWYTVGRVKLYVNRGLGRVGVPVRFLSRPEVAVFTLLPAEE